MQESLLIKYFEGKTSEEESLTVEKWAKNNENKKEFSKYLELWLLLKKTPSYNTDTLKAWNKTRNIIEHKSKNKIVKLSFLKIAASIIILIGFSYGTFNLYNTYFKNKTESYLETYAPYGEKTIVSLPDGTVINLNSGTKLKYPVSFGKKNRKVLIEGEGYFNVAHNKKLPFIVETGLLNIEVLGTKFNVKCYKENETIETYLAEGSIALSKPNSKNEKIVLKPTNKATLHKKTNKLQIEKEIAENNLGWISGKLIFNSEPIKQMAQILERNFNINIEFADNKAQNYTYSGTFIDESIDEIMYAISLASPLNIDKQQDNTFIISSTNN